MPDAGGLRPGDPASVGEFTLSRRLGEGGQGIVYLATGANGVRVAVKLLRSDLAGDREASERFVREVAMARRVAPFCTAQVIETGLTGGRPYIVSEYIDGPTLTEVVRAEGPRSGASLHRLAIGTVTALVAIHQAGIVHRDFKPSNVVLASDGPRVIDFGIARALDLTSTLTSSAIGTPSYMAPEQLMEDGAGPLSDMFAWACTLLFAATGHAPFGEDGIAAVVNRIINAEADVTPVEDPALRALVADCLAKNPARRPAAGQALMRLLGHGTGQMPGGGTPGLLHEGTAVAAAAPVPPSASGPFASPGPAGPFAPPGPSGPSRSSGHSGSSGPAGRSAPSGQVFSGPVPAWSSGPAGPMPQTNRGYQPPPPPQARPLHGQPPAPLRTRPAARRATRWIAAAAAACAVVLVATVAFFAVRLNGPNGTRATSSPANTLARTGSGSPAATTPAPTPSPTPTPSASPQPATRTIALPGSSVEITENDSDPIKLASYSLSNGKRLYVRRAGSSDFAANGGYFEYALDATGTRALGTDVDYSSDHYALAAIIDHRTGTRRTVKISVAPIFPTTPRWSPDGTLGLVTLYKATNGVSVPYGYGVIDIAQGTAKTYQIKDRGAGEWRFFWAGDSRSVGTWSGGALKVYGLDGKAVRTISPAGAPVWVEGDDVSPSGGLFLSQCTAAGGSLCARATSGGDRSITIPFASTRLIGWWDDRHVAGWRTRGDGYEAVVVDLKGRIDRVLATAGKKTEFDDMGFRYSRGTP